MSITKEVVQSMFSELWSESLVELPLLDSDVIAKREAWNNYTDALCKDGVITESQYNNWTNPF